MAFIEFPQKRLLGWQVYRADVNFRQKKSRIARLFPQNGRLISRPARTARR
jgi:hypothetical protein